MNSTNEARNVCSFHWIIACLSCERYLTPLTYSPITSPPRYAAALPLDSLSTEMHHYRWSKYCGKDVWTIRWAIIRTRLSYKSMGIILKISFPSKLCTIQFEAILEIGHSFAFFCETWTFYLEAPDSTPRNKFFQIHCVFSPHLWRGNSATIGRSGNSSGFYRLANERGFYTFLYSFLLVRLLQLTHLINNMLCVVSHYDWYLRP